MVNWIIKEVKRKLMHAGGIIGIIPLVVLPKDIQIKVIALFIILALFLHWYWDRRNLRQKYLNNIIEGMPVAQKKGILQGANQIKKFEEEVLFGFMKDVTRKKEKEPMLATFYYLLSAFLALVLFGTPFAIFGLFSIAIGDAFATLIGKYFGKHKLFWNSEKSIEGWIGFFAATSLSIFAFLLVFPQFAVFNPLWIAVIAGVAGASIETIPTINDNSSIPLGVGFVIWIASLI